MQDIRVYDKTAVAILLQSKKATRWQGLFNNSATVKNRISTYDTEDMEDHDCWFHHFEVAKGVSLIDVSVVPESNASRNTSHGILVYQVQNIEVSELQKNIVK